MIRITMDETDMDSFIFAVGEKKAVGRLQKDMNDMVRGLSNISIASWQNRYSISCLRTDGQF